MAQSRKIKSFGYGIDNPKGKFHYMEFERRPVGDDDVLIEIKYAGICHSDIHHVRSEWGRSIYPIIPGHEIAGVVTQVGKKVKKFKVGDYAGVGCMVNSCGVCPHCKKHEEQFCDRGETVYTYGSLDRDGTYTMGGYSNNMVVRESFAIKIPKSADMKRVAPLLCAGITTYSPLRFTNVKKGDKVGVVGFGGLGHMAVQYAVLKGADVTVFDITEDKRKLAKKLGAKKYVNINNADELKGLENSFRIILSTVPAKYDVAMYVDMLVVDGELVIIGVPANDRTPSIDLAQIGNDRKKIYGTLIGGIKETQDMLNYSVKNNVYPMVEMITPENIDEAYGNVVKGKVYFRYVIDIEGVNNKNKK